MIDLKLDGDGAVVQQFQDATATLSSKVTRAVEQVGQELVRTVQDRYLSGQALGVRTGRLRASIAPGHPDSLSGPLVSGDQISYQVGSSVPYAMLYEQGGVIPSHPVWKYGHVPARPVAPHPFLAPALAQYQQRFEEAVQAAAEEALK